MFKIDKDLIIEKCKNIQNQILEFLDDENNDLFDSTHFLKTFENDFQHSCNDFKLILYLLAKISNNHHRSHHFFTKIEQIILLFKDYIIKSYTSSEIVHIFQKNKHIILFLFEQRMIKLKDFINESIVHNYSQYFSPEIESNMRNLLKNNDIFDEISINFQVFYVNIFVKSIQKFPFLKILNANNFNSNSNIVSNFRGYINSKFELIIENFIKYLFYYDRLSSHDDTQNNTNMNKANHMVLNKKVTLELSNDFLYQIIDSKIRTYCGEKNANYRIINTKTKFYDEKNNTADENMIESMYDKFYKKIKSLICISNDEKDENIEKEEEEKEQMNSMCTEIMHFVDFIPNSFKYNQNLYYVNYTDSILGYFYILKSMDIDENNEKTNIILSKIRIFIDEIFKAKSEKKFTFNDLQSKSNKLLEDIIEYNFEKEFEEFFQKMVTLLDDMNNQLKIQNLDEFEQNRNIGENESYICQLIRNDSVDEFITFTQRKNIFLSSQIKPSIFETNSFLIKNQPTLIEYAAFYGSIQIFQYLKLNQVELTQSLWLYAIHGRNAEIIHILEENGFYLDKENSLICLNESIKCYHNEIANYIINNYLDIQSDDFYDICNDNNIFCLLESYDLMKNNQIHLFKESKDLSANSFQPYLKKSPNQTNLIAISSIRSHNYEFFSDNFKSSDFFYYFCRYGMCAFVEQIVRNQSSEFGFDSLTSNDINNAVRIAAVKEHLNIAQICVNSLLTEIPPNFFEKCTLKEITIPSSITKIGDKAFYKCKLLKKIVIPQSVTKIGEFAFFGCLSLTEISIPSSVTKIGEHAFSKCPLTEVTIHSSVISIGKDVFPSQTLVIHSLFNSQDDFQK